MRTLDRVQWSRFGIRPRFLIPILVLPAAVYLLVDVVPPMSLTVTAMETCKRRIQAYAMQHNALPSALSETRQPREDFDWTKDGWGRPISYSVDANGVVTLASSGKDNKHGGTGNNADMVGAYLFRKSDGEWSDGLVPWIKDPTQRE